jgi:hypothetical protein
MEPNFEKKLYKAAVVNTDELVKAEARDVGDARMTESKEERSGNWFTKMGKRIWKHNLAQEWYRQREISRVKKDILESGNLYVGEKDFDSDKTTSNTASKEAMQAIVERFTSEYEDEVLKEEERESKRTIESEEINKNIKDLIKQYAGSAMTAESFEEEKKRILSRYDKNMASKKSMYADNLLSIANDVRGSIVQGAKLSELDFDLELTVGKAKESLSTQAHQTSFDKGMEKFQNSKVGKYIANSPAALSIAAGLYSVGKNMLHRTIRSKWAQWTTFGVASVASGGLAAAKERARITRERAQHQRESAKGMEFKEGDMKRRQEMEGNSYNTKKATMIIENLNNDLLKVKEGKFSPDEVTDIMARLADLEARIKLNDQKKIDLIAYDKFNTLEKDRTAMDLKRAELKVALRQSEGVENFDDELSKLIDVQKTQLLEGEQGIEQKDEVFRKLRNSKAWKAFAKGTIVGGTIGMVFQEGKALLDGSQDGIIEGSIKHFTGKEDLVKHGTALEALRRWFSGDHGMMKTGLHEEAIVDGTHMQVPDGVSIEQNPDHTISILRNGEVVSDHVPLRLDEQGNLSEETQQALAKSGVSADFGLIGEKTTENIHESVQDYVNKHAEGMTKVHRDLWYDNNTPHPFDKNELRTDWGAGGTGIDANGNYVFNVARMSDAGSFHGSETIDASGQVHKGALKMLFSFSRDTQHQVFEVPIGPDGNAVIDPNSTLGKLMFENHNGHAIFTGQFAEVAQSTGTAADGGETVRILSTHVGHGKEFIDSTISTDTTSPNLIFRVPNPDTYDVPPVIPIMGRRPLEKGEYKKNREVEANRPKQEEDNGIQVEVNEQPAAPTTGGETIPTGAFRADIAEIIKYARGKFTGLEEKVLKDVDHVYAFTGLDRESIDKKLKTTKKYTKPQVFIFENDSTKRDKNLKQVEALKKWYPKVKFTYVGLPKDNIKLDPEDLKDYSKKRLESILNKSKVDGKKVKHELHVETIAKKPLGPVSETEFEKFMDTGKVSRARLHDIAEKIKKNAVLSPEEQSMRTEHSAEVERLLR